MNKVEITSNVCLVCINTGCENTEAISHIEHSLFKNNIVLLFISSVNVFGQNDKIYIAVYEADIFRLMSVLGKIRAQASIINYSINCSNSMIKWRGKIPPALLQKSGCDIKLSLMLSDEGVCFCDTACKDRIYSLITCRAGI